jgi:serine protease Do
MLKRRSLVLCTLGSLLAFAGVVSRLGADEKLTELVKKVQPSVVVIFTFDADGKPLGQGSGFLYGADELVVTNHHVLDKASFARIKLSNKKMVPVARVHAVDEQGDLMMVSLGTIAEEAVSLPVNREMPEVGSDIVVIGSPLGLEMTVSQGIVSAVREVEWFPERIMQISAPISPGSSGGPVFNMKGEVVGVVMSQMVNGQNLNFAIPGSRVVGLERCKPRTLAEWTAGLSDQDLEAADEQYQQGEDSWVKSQYEEALPFLDEAIRINASHEEAYRAMGYCLKALNRPDDARKAFQNLTRINPDFAESYKHLASLETGLGNYDAAITALREVTRIEPALAGGWCDLAVACRNFGSTDDAIAAFKEAVRLEPDLYRARYGLAYAYEWRGDWTDAAESYRAALRIWPDSVWAHASLSGVLINMDEKAAAEAECREVIRLAPEDADLRQHVALDLAELGLYEDSIAQFREAIKLRPEFYFYEQMGGTYHLMGRYDDAIQAYKDGMEISPDYTVLHMSLVKTYNAAGRYEDSLETCGAAIAIDGETHYWCSVLGDVYTLLERHDEAVDAYTKAVELDSFWGETPYKLGEALERAGRAEEAPEAYGKALEALASYAERFPDDGATRLLLGKTHLKLGDKDAALQDYETLKGLDEKLAEELGKLLE